VRREIARNVAEKTRRFGSGTALTPLNAELVGNGAPWMPVEIDDAVIVDVDLPVVVLLRIEARGWPPNFCPDVGERYLC
jgi:hypothetical protein